jgi:hypothetical protein
MRLKFYNLHFPKGYDMTNHTLKTEDNIHHRFFDPSKLLRVGDIPSITNCNKARFAKLFVSRLQEVTNEMAMKNFKPQISCQCNSLQRIRKCQMHTEPCLDGHYQEDKRKPAKKDVIAKILRFLKEFF